MCSRISCSFIECIRGLGYGEPQREGDGGQEEVTGPDRHQNGRELCGEMR